MSDKIMSIEDKKTLLIDMGFNPTGDPGKFVKYETPAVGQDLVIGFSFTEKTPEGIFWGQINKSMMKREEVDALKTVNLFYAEKDRRMKGKGKIPPKEGKKRAKAKTAPLETYDAPEKEVVTEKKEVKKMDNDLDEQTKALFEKAGVDQKEYLIAEYDVESVNDLPMDERQEMVLKLRQMARNGKKAKTPAKVKTVPPKAKSGEEVQVSTRKNRQMPMMIKNLTPRLVEVGKIKIGGKGETRTKSGTLLPEKWDHFGIATMLKDDEGRLVMDDDINAIIGDNCRELDIYLAFDDPRVNCPTWYGEYSASGVRCMGDGETAIRDEEEIECDPETCESYRTKKCKMHGRLSVILADSRTISGVYVFRTTSFYSISNILSSMVSIARETGGILAGIPLKMKMTPQTVSPEGVGGSVRIWTVYIDYDGTPSELKNEAFVERQKRDAIGMNMEQIEADSTMMIEAGIENEDAIDIVEEFMPDNMDVEK